MIEGLGFAEKFAERLFQLLWFVVLEVGLVVVNYKAISCGILEVYTFQDIGGESQLGGNKDLTVRHRNVKMSI